MEKQFYLVEREVYDIKTAYGELCAENYRGWQQFFTTDKDVADKKFDDLNHGEEAINTKRFFKKGRNLFTANGYGYQVFLKLVSVEVPADFDEDFSEIDPDDYVDVDELKRYSTLDGVDFDKLIAERYFSDDEDDSDGEDDEN